MTSGFRKPPEPVSKPRSDGSRENDDGLPVDFVASDLLSGVTCRPYRRKPYDPGTADGPPPSRYMAGMDSRTDYSTRGSEYRVLIHWES